MFTQLFQELGGELINTGHSERQDGWIFQGAGGLVVWLSVAPLGCWLLVTLGDWSSVTSGDWSSVTLGDWSSVTLGDWSSVASGEDWSVASGGDFKENDEGMMVIAVLGEQ